MAGPTRPWDYVELFYQLFTHISDAAWITARSDGRILEANPVFLTLSGLTREQAIGRTTSELGVRGDASPRQRSVEFVSAEDEVHDYRLRRRGATGEVVILAVAEIGTTWRGVDVVLHVGKPEASGLPEEPTARS